MASDVVAVKRADLDDVLELVPRVRPADLAELWAAGHATPREVIEPAIAAGEAFAAYFDGSIGCVFGVMPYGWGAVGIPWMVGTATLERHPMAFLRAARARLPEMLRPHAALVNFVDARNTKAVQWLRWMGFQIDEPKPYGLDRLPFHRFTLVNPDV